MSANKSYATEIAANATEPLIRALESTSSTAYSRLLEVLEDAYSGTDVWLRTYDSQFSRAAMQAVAVQEETLKSIFPRETAPIMAALESLLPAITSAQKLADAWSAAAIQQSPVGFDNITKLAGESLAASLPSALALLDGRKADTDNEINPEALPPLTQPTRAERATLTSATRAFKDFPLWQETYARLRHHYGNLSRAQLHTLRLLTSVLVFTAVLVGVTTLTDNDPALEHAMDNVGATPYVLAASAGASALWCGTIAIRRHPINKRVDRRLGR